MRIVRSIFFQTRATAFQTEAVQTEERGIQCLLSGISLADILDDGEEMEQDIDEEHDDEEADPTWEPPCDDVSLEDEIEYEETRYSIIINKLFSRLLSN